MNTQINKQNIVWGALLIIFGALGLVQVYTQFSAWTWVIILAAVGLGVFVVYLSDRSLASLLIPVYAFWAIAGLIALVELNVLRNEVIAFYVLTAIALPFLVVYYRNREHWWALIPAYVMLAVGLMVMLIEGGILGDDLVPAYVMFAVAIPFFVVYARNSRHWWALIPAGILSIIGVSFLIAESAIQYIAPFVLVLVGVWIIARQFLRKGTTPPDESGSSGSESDDSLVE